MCVLAVNYSIVCHTRVAGVVVDTDLADVGALHIGLAAVQVQGAVFSSTYHHILDRHLASALRRQHALLLHLRPVLLRVVSRQRHRRRGVLRSPRPVSRLLHRSVDFACKSVNFFSDPWSSSSVPGTGSTLDPCSIDE